MQTFLVVSALVGLIPAITLAERDTALGRLRESETHYRNLTEAAFEGVCISENGRLLDVSNQLLTMIGYERHEVLGRTIPEFIAPEKRETVAAAIQAEKEAPDLVQLVRKDGRMLNCEVRAKVVQVGNHTLRMTAVRDISERLKAEEALRSSEARLRAVSDNLPNGIVYQVVREKDGTMRFLHVSAGVERTHGLMAEAVLREPQLLYAQILPDDAARLITAEEKSFQTMGVLDEIMRFRRADGDLRWARLCSAPRREPDGRVIWDGIEVDITESKRAEDALRQSEEKFSKAFLSSPSSILITRLSDGRIVEANDTFCRRYEVPLGTARGRTVFELGVWNNPAERDKLMERLKREGFIRNFEKTGVLPSGRRFVSLLSLEQLKIQGEDCLLTVTHDISDLKEAQRALQENETKFRTLFNSANDAIFLMKGLEILDCNRMTEVLFGHAREQIIGRTPIDFSPEHQPDGESSVAKGDKKIAAVIAGQPQFFEWTHRRPDGTSFDAEVSLNRVELDGALFVQAIVRDSSPRKATEITLKLLSQRFRLAAAAAAAAVWEWNLQTDDILVDERMFALYGYPMNPEGRFSYEQWTARVHPQDLPEQEAILKQTIATKGQSKREFRIYRTDGTPRYVQAAEIVICDTHGVAVRMVGVNIDITERKTAEAALRESEGRYRAVVEFSPDCIAVTVEEQIVYINHAGAKMLGAESPAILVGKTIYDFAPVATHSAIQTRRQRVLSTGVASPLFETVMLRLDGRPVQIESQAVPFVYSGRGAVLYLLRDITARKQAEQQLQENQRMLTTLMANLPGMVYRCQNDASWTMQFVSEGCHALTGYRSQDLLANRTTNFAALLHPDDLELVRQTVQSALQRKGVFEVNYRIRTAIDEEKWVWERGQGVFSAEGDLIALEGFITDITAQRKAEAEREAATKREQETRAEFTRQLIASQEAERTRIAREIHDHLGQLLTALKLDLRSLERRASVLSDTELQTALLGKVKSAKELADETITSVQKIASELRPGILDRLGLAAAIEAEAQTFASRTGVSCPCAVPEETPPIPQDRAIAAFRIFQEIMTNVARHAHATEVRIQLRLSATILELVVADNGIGLAEKHFTHPKSFGLLGMMERAEILGGQIEFRKRPGGSGTVVAVRLPLGETKLPS
ncbi:MAG: PAS domain S-box protein [Verrucomicrobiota bacterium]